MRRVYQQNIDAYTYSLNGTHLTISRGGDTIMYIPRKTALPQLEKFLNEAKAAEELDKRNYGS